MSLRLLTICALAALLLQGCGFTPLYATDDPAARPVLAQIDLAAVEANENVEPMLTRAIERRAAREGDAALFDLVVRARESAQPLAVQIDASVTRYNYSLAADYTLTRRRDGREFKGNAQAVASFNVVDSQYSTLFAEEAAREKASRVLVEEIERSILLKMAEAEEQAPQAARPR